jgi:hypothetical protein
MYRTNSIRITNTNTGDPLQLRRIEDEGKAIASTVGKEDILPATVIRKRAIIVSLKEGIIQEQDTSKAEHQGEHSQLSRSLTMPLPASPLFESH